jgi:hypothetical protein
MPYRAPLIMIRASCFVLCLIVGTATPALSANNAVFLKNTGAKTYQIKIEMNNGAKHCNKAGLSPNETMHCDVETFKSAQMHALQFQPFRSCGLYTYEPGNFRVVDHDERDRNDPRKVVTGCRIQR